MDVDDGHADVGLVHIHAHVQLGHCFIAYENNLVSSSRLLLWIHVYYSGSSFFLILFLNNSLL